MWSQPVRKHGCGERDVAPGRLERSFERWRHAPTGSPLCAGDHGVAHVEREQKDEEPR